MRLSFLVPLLGLALGPRPIVSNTITVAEVEEVTGATDAGDGYRARGTRPLQLRRQTRRRNPRGQRKAVAAGKNTPSVRAAGV